MKKRLAILATQMVALSYALDHIPSEKALCYTLDPVRPKCPYSLENDSSVRSEANRLYNNNPLNGLNSSFLDGAPVMANLGKYFWILDPPERPLGKGYWRFGRYSPAVRSHFFNDTASDGYRHKTVELNPAELNDNAIWDLFSAYLHAYLPHNNVDFKPILYVKNRQKQAVPDDSSQDDLNPDFEQIEQINPDLAEHLDNEIKVNPDFQNAPSVDGVVSHSNGPLSVQKQEIEPRVGPATQHDEPALEKAAINNDITNSAVINNWNQNELILAPDNSTVMSSILQGSGIPVTAGQVNEEMNQQELEKQEPVGLPLPDVSNFILKQLPAPIGDQKAAQDALNQQAEAQLKLKRGVFSQWKDALNQKQRLAQQQQARELEKQERKRAEDEWLAEKQRRLAEEQELEQEKQTQKKRDVFSEWKRLAEAAAAKEALKQQQDVLKQELLATAAAKKVEEELKRLELEQRRLELEQRRLAVIAEQQQKQNLLIQNSDFPQKSSVQNGRLPNYDYFEITSGNLKGQVILVEKKGDTQKEEEGKMSDFSLTIGNLNCPIKDVNGLKIDFETDEKQCCIKKIVTDELVNKYLATLEPQKEVKLTKLKKYEVAQSTSVCCGSKDDTLMALPGTSNYWVERTDYSRVYVTGFKYKGEFLNEEFKIKDKQIKSLPKCLFSMSKTVIILPSYIDDRDDTLNAGIAIKKTNTISENEKTEKWCSVF